jgi:hypothetical protein
MSIKALSDYTIYAKYARYNPEKKRRETWQEQVDRVFGMHERKFKHILETNQEFKEDFEFAKQQVYKKRVLGSQRSLQFGGPQIEKHNTKLYNCAYTYVSRPEVFSEIMYLLLCGVGVGFSVQSHHIAHIPEIRPRTGNTAIHIIEDSVEGWADAVDVLMKSYFHGFFVEFDYSLIRPEGSIISGGFKAPGPKGLENSLNKVVSVIDRRLNSGETRLRSIDCYDVIMHLSDAVLSGGVRRCLPETYSVKMADGSWKKIADIVVGDEVLYRGKAYKVNNTFNNGAQELVKINTPDGYHVSTPNHKWLVYNVEANTVEWVEAQNLVPEKHKFMREKNK